MVDISACAARPFAVALAVIAAGFLPGCASITGTELQLLSLQVSDKDGATVAGADCKLSNDKGTWHAKPPASATVLRSSEDLLVSCEAAGQAPGTVRAISRANAGMAGNIIFGGIIGAVIDHSRGTAYDYPSMIGVVFGASRTIDRNDEFGASPSATVAPATSTAPAQMAKDPAPVALAETGPNAPASSTLPSPGARFRYAWTEQQYSGRRQEFHVFVSGVDGWKVMEAFSAGGSTPVRTEIQARELAFTGRLLAEGQSLLEFSPYLQAPGEMNLPPIRDPSGYPNSDGSSWKVSVQPRGRERVSVPAGTFDALKIEVQGTLDFANSTPTASILMGVARRFEYTAWYIPELKRYAKSRHRSWNASSASISDELVELLEYRPN